jgi:hypothetical protein
MVTDDEEMAREAVEWLRPQLPGRPEAELRKIVEEELLWYASKRL